MQLYRICLLSHPSGDHMDLRADVVEDFFTLGTSFYEARKKVVRKVKNSSHYDIACFLIDKLPLGVTPEQALEVLRVVGVLKVID